MWKAREDAMNLLRGEFQSKAALLDELFSLIDECIDLFEKKSATSEFHRICGLTLLKAKNLTLGCYSLILDGLGQEAGALMRPFIEYHELLTYFRLDPSRVSEAANDSLPSAGRIAKAIEGYFQNFREHLNENASHSAYSLYSLNHLLERPHMGFRKLQRTMPIVLEKNITDLFVQVLLLTREAIRCLDAIESGCCEVQAGKADSLRERGIRVFELAKRLDQMAGNPSLRSDH